MTASIHPPNPAPIDVDHLYRAHARHLQLIVRHDLHEVSEALVEDACQFAWSRLVIHAARIRSESALSWLARTAVHEGFKLIRRQARETPLERAGEAQATGGVTDLAPDPYEVLEARARLSLPGQLSERQARFVWLHALGLSYREIGRYSDCTPRTVERQLMRARLSLHALSAA